MKTILYVFAFSMLALPAVAGQPQGNLYVKSESVRCGQNDKERALFAEPYMKTVTGEVKCGQEVTVFENDGKCAASACVHVKTDEGKEGFMLNGAFKAGGGENETSNSGTTGYHTKGKWVFTTRNTVNAKGKTGTNQELTLSAEEAPGYKQDGKIPQLSLVCLSDTLKFQLFLYNAGIFNTYLTPYGVELSSVNLRWEAGDGIASSFFDSTWYKLPERDVLTYTADTSVLNGLFSSETLLLEPNVKVGSVDIARFDIRGLQEHISEMTICVKELTKASHLKPWPR